MLPAFARRPVLLAILALASCNRMAKPFEGRLEEFDLVQFQLTLSDGTVPDGQMPYRTGRVFILHADTRNPVIIGMMGRKDPYIEPAWFKLSDDLRARKPEEVDTLIQVNSGTIAGEKDVVRREGDRVWTERKYVGQQYPVKVYDLRRRFLIGTWMVDSWEGQDEVGPLVQFVKEMPFKPGN